MAKGAKGHRVVVVGAGIGGLVSALVLAHRGLDVTLVEAASAPGGKIRQVSVDGVGVDSGPTVFTMRWVFDQMLAEIGTSLGEILQLEPLNTLARHAWDGRPAIGFVCRHTAISGCHRPVQWSTRGASIFRFLRTNAATLRHP